MDNILRHHQVHRETFPNINRNPFYDNGLLSDSSDDDCNQGKHLTFVNKVKENRPKSRRSQRTPIQYKNQTPFFKNNFKTVDGINDSDDVGDSKNDLTVVNNVRPVSSGKFKRSSDFFPNGNEYVESCSDEDEPPINHLTHINRIQPNALRTNKVNKLPNNEGNHEEHINLENESFHCWNNLLTKNDTSSPHPLYRKWQPEVKDNYRLNSSNSTTSTLSSSSYFENGSIDEIDDERFVSLTFKNDLKSENPDEYKNLQAYPSFVTDETKPVTGRLYFNNCSDDDEDDQTDFGEFLTCKNKFTPSGQNHLPIKKFANVYPKEQNNDTERKIPPTETNIQTKNTFDRSDMDQCDNSKRGNFYSTSKPFIATTNDTDTVNKSDNQRSDIQQRNITTINHSPKTVIPKPSVQTADTYSHVTEDQRFNNSNTADTITLSFELKLNTSAPQPSTEEGLKVDSISDNATSLVQHEKTVKSKEKVSQAIFFKYDDDEIERKNKLNCHPNAEVEESTTEYTPRMSDFFRKPDLLKSSNNHTLDQGNLQSREIQLNNHSLEQESLQSQEIKPNDHSLEQRSLQSHEIKPNNHILEQGSLQSHEIKPNNHSLEQGSLQIHEIKPNNHSLEQESLQSQEIKPNNHSLEQRSLQSHEIKPNNHSLEQGSLQSHEIKPNNHSLEQESLQSHEIKPNNHSLEQGSFQIHEIKPNNHSLEQESLQSRPTKPPMTQCNPFRTTFNSVGLRSEGQTIFEMRLKDTKLNNTGIDEDEDDLEIDEKQRKTEPTKLQQDSTNSSVTEPTKLQKESTNSSVIRKSKEKKSSIRRQSSQGAYKHTCTGCGRKDCDGNFMKLLRAMIKTGREKGFEIRNVVPDGNCMFAAVIDQLELLDDCNTSPFALRQACTKFLESNPNSEDGTPFCLFLDAESWEDYLSRMSQEGQWGDHLMLHAISNVTKRNITIINGEDEKKWTTLHPLFKDSAKQDPLYLGHVGELHYVSMRPIPQKESELRDDEYTSIDLYNMMPSLPNLEETNHQDMFLEDYIDPWSEIPAVHFTFLIKQFIPMKATIKYADSMCHQAFALESSSDDFVGGSKSPFQFKAIGDVVEGFFVTLDGKPEDECFGFWVDVGIICSLTTCIAYPQNFKNSGTIDQSDVTVCTNNTHPGYARLLARFPDTWGFKGKAEGGRTYYIPNKHHKFEDSSVTKRIKDQYANQNPMIVHLFSQKYSGIYSPFWPEKATSWRSRSRDANWPSPDLIDSIVSEGVYYIGNPHTNSPDPDIEFQICFGVVERRLANEALSKEQRYCFIVFKALVSHTLMGDESIESSHLKSVFFSCCEQVPQQYWSSRVSGCILYLVDTLIRQIDHGNIPNYFISTYNMIDHLTHEQLQGVLGKLQNLRTNPLIALYSIAYQNMVTNADEIYQDIRMDIEDFHEHKSVRHSVIFALVPAKIKQAAKYLELNSFDVAIEIIQEAHEDRLLVSTCEDNIPFVAFVTEVTNSFGLTKQWWLCVHADETLGTALAAELSLLHSPIPLHEIVGSETADRYGDLLIPRPLAESLCSLCYDFYIYLSLKHRKKKAVAFLVKARQLFIQINQYGTFPQDFPCTIDPDDFNLHHIFKIYKSLVQSFIMTTSSESLCALRLDEIAMETQTINEKVNTEEAYTILLLMWKFLGNTEKFNAVSAILDRFAAETPKGSQHIPS
ncbi:uncharacterized protein LOC127700731 isoform X2 [Mytilus californianus]|uniref:uncharacterized protein LOC127700731 isoform X2 n=1 Tax=Mytilus californianus TaxID=6549 RepID=UPI0022486141|nr:uncharacterized protein LOC127700731 isoform X2 [Mytilus californianus]